MQQHARNAALDHLEPLVGDWAIEASHPYLPGAEISGQATFEWLAGGMFLIWRSSYSHPDIPTGLAILGCDDGCTMRYFDSRGVFRVYTFEADPGAAWRFWRNDPEFSQRFTWTLSPDGQTLTGSGQLSRNGSPWEPDLQVTYRKRP